jgi:hypothetical protein
LTECLLRWDNKTRTSKRKGILGIVLAFTGADEEQGCKTLHQHWQIWVKEMSQTVINSLFHKNIKRKNEARKTFCKLIDEVICASYGWELGITHRCVDENKMQIMKTDIPKNMYKQKGSDIF